MGLNDSAPDELFFVRVEAACCIIASLLFSLFEYLSSLDAAILTLGQGSVKALAVILVHISSLHSCLVSRPLTCTRTSPEAPYDRRVRTYLPNSYKASFGRCFIPVLTCLYGILDALRFRANALAALSIRFNRRV